MVERPRDPEKRRSVKRVTLIELGAEVWDVGESEGSPGE